MALLIKILKRHRKALDNIKQDDDYVQNVSNPYETNQVNDDKDTAIATVNYVVNQTSLQDSSKNYQSRNERC